MFLIVSCFFPYNHLFAASIQTQHLPYFLFLDNLVFQRSEPLGFPRDDCFHIQLALQECTIWKLAKTTLKVFRIGASLRNGEVLSLDIHLLAKTLGVDDLSRGRPKTFNEINFQKISHCLKAAAQLGRLNYFHLLRENIIASQTSNYVFNVGAFGKCYQQFD